MITAGGLSKKRNSLTGARIGAGGAGRVERGGRAVGAAPTGSPQNGERASAPNNFMACMPFARDETTTAGTHVCHQSTHASSDALNIRQLDMPRSSGEKWATLSSEILSNVFSELPAPTLMDASATCTAWRAVGLSNTLWHRLVLQDWRKWHPWLARDCATGIDWCKRYAVLLRRGAQQQRPKVQHNQEILVSLSEQYEPCVDAYDADGTLLLSETATFSMASASSDCDSGRLGSFESALFFDVTLKNPIPYPPFTQRWQIFLNPDLETGVLMPFSKARTGGIFWGGWQFACKCTFFLQRVGSCRAGIAV